MGVRMIASNCAPCKAGKFALRYRIGKSSTMKAYQAIPKLGTNLVFPLSLSSILVSGQNGSFVLPILWGFGVSASLFFVSTIE